MLKESLAALKQELARAQNEVNSLTEAIAAIEAIGTPTKGHKAHRGTARASKRRMSPQARKRIAAAQRKRWNTFHKQQKKHKRAA